MQAVEGSMAGTLGLLQAEASSWRLMGEGGPGQGRLHWDPTGHIVQ